MTHLALAPTSPVVHPDSANRHHGKTVALNNVMLDTPICCMVGPTGPDGTGELSLLPLISDAQAIEHGSVTVLGGDTRNPEYCRDVCPRVTRTPQELGKNLHYTLPMYENVGFFARLSGHDKTEYEVRIIELLNSAGLVLLHDRPVGKLLDGIK